MITPGDGNAASALASRMKLRLHAAGRLHQLHAQALKLHKGLYNCPALSETDQL